MSVYWMTESMFWWRRGNDSSQPLRDSFGILSNQEKSAEILNFNVAAKSTTGLIPEQCNTFIISLLKSLVLLQIHNFQWFSRPAGTLCLHTFSTLTNTHSNVPHTRWNRVVVAVCVAMAACCCSDVVERRSSLTRHPMCLRCHWPAGVTWEQSSQSAGKSTLCELKACQHCEQRRRGKEMQWWRDWVRISCPPSQQKESVLEFNL